MSKIGKCIISLLFGAIFISGCNSTPDEVLPKEEMAQLLADIHIGESIVDAEHTKYYNDSLKKVVKQSILVKHGVTQAQLDTSFAWYGYNIEEYIAVYDRVIEILDNDIKELGAGKEEHVKISLDGDSVDTWQEINHYNFSRYSPSQFITFNLSKDRYWEKGDFYTWRMKLINNITPLKWGIAADYEDGTSEFINMTISNEGWNEIKLITDSTKSLNRVYGYIFVVPNENEVIYLDSITLVRMRSNKDIYHQRFGQKQFDYGKKNANNEDSSSEIQENKLIVDTPQPPKKDDKIQNTTSRNNGIRLRKN